jgi:hypothetical protein
VTKPALMKKLETMVDDFAQGRVWGTIEIQFTDGQPAIVRKMTTEKLDATENNRARYQNNGSR